MELDLKNPIFVFYLNVDGISRQRAEESIRDYNQMFSNLTNITVWILAVSNGQPTKLECVFDGGDSNDKKTQKYNKWIRWENGDSQ